MAVRGVAREEHVADAVVRCLPLVAMEAGHPPWIVHAEVGAERVPYDRTDLLEVDRRRVRQGVARIPREDSVPTVAERRDEGEPVGHRIDREDVARRIGEADI